MKRIIAIVGLILLSGGALFADIGIVGKKEMVAQGEYVGVNWYMSYLYLDGKTIEWFNETGEIVETYIPGQVIRYIKRPGCAQSSSNIDSYTLTVELNTPFNKNFIMKTFVVPGKHFELTKLNGGTRNTISGMLKPPVDGKYRIDLTVSEWVSEKSNIKDTTELNLELDNAWSGGPVSSFMYLRTVTLSKVEL